MQKFFSLVLISLLATGCASVVRLPASTGQAPVVGGGLFKVRTGVDFTNSIPVTIIQDITTNPPTRNRIGVGEEDTLFVGDVLGLENSFGGSGWDFGLGIIERLDIYYTRNFGLRFMIFGDPKGQGWRSTIFAGGYFGDDDTSTTLSGNIFTSKVDTEGYELGLSIGNQIDKYSLFYITLASRGGKANVFVEENNVIQYQAEDEFDHYISTLGFMHGDTWYIKVEASGNQIEWRGSDTNGLPIKDSAFEFGASLGFGYIW